MITLLTLLACKPAPPVDPLADSFAFVLRRLDHDGDGKVTAAEYTAVTYAAPAFAAADTDQDGALGPPELAALVRTQDPVYFDKMQTFPSRGTTHMQGMRPAEAGKYEARTLRDLYRFLAAEVAAKGGLVPDDATLTAAAATGSLESPESLAVLRALDAAAKGVGLELPEKLRP